MSHAPRYFVPATVFYCLRSRTPRGSITSTVVYTLKCRSIAGVRFSLPVLLVVPCTRAMIRRTETPGPPRARWRESGISPD